MNNLFKRGALSARFRLSRHMALAIAALSLGWVGLRGQTHPVLTTADKPGLPMKQFVLLFRQSPTHLSEAEQKRRAEEVRAWALRQNEDGRKLDPRILGPENYRVGPDGNGGPAGETGDGPLIAITFLEARDFAEAVSIADSHPGLRYGVSVEVRSWGPPPAPPTASRP